MTATIQVEQVDLYSLLPCRLILTVRPELHQKPWSLRCYLSYKVEQLTLCQCWPPGLYGRWSYRSLSLISIFIPAEHPMWWPLFNSYTIIPHKRRFHEFEVSSFDRHLQKNFIYFSQCDRFCHFQIRQSWNQLQFLPNFWQYHGMKRLLPVLMGFVLLLLLKHWGRW